MVQCRGGKIDSAGDTQRRGGSKRKRRQYITMWAKHSSPIMIRRAKRAAIFASPFVLVGAWAGYVLKERRKPPADVRFGIGSAGVCLMPLGRLRALLLAFLHPQ